MHPNTAFGLAFALDYALEVGAVLLVQRSQDYLLKDRDYPATWEPGGEDFFSPALMEADLMRRAWTIVTSGHYAGEHWLATYAVYMLATPRS